MSTTVSSCILLSTAALCVASPRAQSPGPDAFTVTGCQPGATIFGFGDASTRLLAKNTFGDIGWFDAAGTPPTFATLEAASVAVAINNIVWERGSLPTSAWHVHNNSVFTGTIPPIFGVSQLWQALVGPPGGSVGSVFLSLNPADDWTLDAIAPSNTRFFLRLAVAGGWSVHTCTTSSSPTALAPTVVALQPLTLSPNGNRLAFVSQGTGVQRVTILPGLPSPATPLHITVPAGSSLDDLAWIDDNRLVARMHPNGSPAAGRIVRIDSQPPTPGIVDLTLPGQFCRDLEVSGDRQWLTFVVSQTVTNSVPSSANELSAVAMRITDGTTASPGGAFIVLSPLQTWNILQGPHIQHSATAENPFVVFPAIAPGATLPSFHRATMLHDVSIVGRVLGAVSTTIDVRAPALPANDMWVLGVSLERTTVVGVPPMHVLNPVVLGPFFNFPPTQPLTVGGGGVPFNAEMFFQAGWFTQGNLAVGRVTELQIF